jgi:hypothetical protein
VVSADCEFASRDPPAPVRNARKDTSEAGQLAGAIGGRDGGEPLAVRLAPQVGLALAGNHLMDVRTGHGPSSFAHQTGETAAFFPVLAPARVIEDDAPVPKSHKIAVPGNPVEGPELREKVSASLGDQGTITESLFHPKKNLAIVTIETEEDLSFEEVTRLLGDVEPFQVGPINLENVPE